MGLMLIKFGVKAIKDVFFDITLALLEFCKSFNAIKIKAMYKKYILNSNKVLRTAINKTKNLFVTNLELGLYHYYKGNLSDASLRFRLIRIIKNKSPLGGFYLGRCAITEGKTNKSITLFQQALELDPTYLPAKIYLDIVKHEFIHDIPLEIIRNEFEYKAHYYVQKFLIDADYMGHKIILDELISVFGKEVVGIDVLDIGCGTGICGHFFRMCNTCRNIDGIDLSENMLMVARSCRADGRTVYGTLTQGNYLSILKKSIKKYDAVISVITFNYLHKVEDAIILCLKQLKKNGTLVAIVITNNDDNKISFDAKNNIFLHGESSLKESFNNVQDTIPIDCCITKCTLYNDREAIMITCTLKKND